MLEKGFAPTATKQQTCIRLTVFVVVLVFGVFLLAPTHTSAQITDAANNVNQIAQISGVGQTPTLPEMIGRIVNIVLGFTGILLLGYLLYAGYLWMTSGGEMEKVDRAKTIIKQAIIGLIIIVSAFAITRFILESLFNVTQDGGGVTSSSGLGAGFPGSAGALGNGILESHIPQRDAKDVARNTAIAITFKEPMKISSMIQDYGDNGTPTDLTDDVVTTGINANSIKIFATTAGRETALTTAQVRVAFTPDRKTFVFRPVEYLGSPSVKMDYTVELTPGIQRQDGRAAFGANGYKWQFQVSTVIDLTPPKVVSVVPYDGGRFAPNVVVQVNFDEPVDPTSASGIFNNDPTLGRFLNLAIMSESTQSGSESTQVTGEFKAVNAFKTVEFISDASCGVNSCGRQVFCLPFNAAISATVKAATLSANAPQASFSASGYDGVVDMAGNSLDGNGDGRATGPGSDNRVWRFGTESAPNLTPPHITATEPLAQTPPSSQAQNLPLDHKPSATFESVLQASTVNSDNIKLLNNEPAADQSLADTFWFTVSHEALGTNSLGQLVPANSRDVQASQGRISINHRLYLPPIESPVRQDFEYDPHLSNGLQNIYQNCFNPAASTVCSGPNCCNNTSRADCGFPSRP